MYFCNLIGNNAPIRYERKIGSKHGIPFVVGCKEACQVDGGNVGGIGFQYVDGEVVVDILGCPDSAKNNLFFMGQSLDQYVMPPIKKRGQWTNPDTTLWADVRDTEENPAIVVLCKAIHLVNGVKSYIKMMNINEDTMLVMLVCGSVGFEDSEGEVMYMNRNLPEGISVDRRATKRISPEKMNEMILMKDKSGYTYNMDAVIAAYVYFGSDLVNVKVMRDDSIIFDPEAIERSNALQKAAEEKARKEEERKAEEAKKAEEYRLRVEKEREEQRKKEEAEVEAKRALAREKGKAKAAATRAAKSEIKTPEGNARNAGADMFLSMLMGK